MKEIIKKLKNKKVAILGLGIENISLLEYLMSIKAECEITVCDARSKHKIKDRYEGLERYGFAWRLGKDYDKDLRGFDIMFRAPGYPLFSSALKVAQTAGALISSPTKLFFEFVPTTNIVGVTGTKGKGTTSGLIFEILKRCKGDVYWGGNIGIPVFDFFSDLDRQSWVVLELSSFQLEDLEISPRYAVITNLGEEHLAPADPLNPNYHKSADAYYRAKFNIIRWQKKDDYAIINKKLKASRLLGQKGALALGHGRKIYFGKSDFPSRLVGEHNRENIAAAVELSRVLNIKDGLAKKAIRKFKGLPHRLELVGETGGVKYYDDSFATTPEAVITALNSFTGPIILIAGGADKGSNFKNLAKRVKDKADFVVLFKGQATPRIEAEFKKIGYSKNKYKIVDSMAEAARLAKKQAGIGAVVLMSPACASFGLFKNYKERGDLFKQEVKKL